jgi:hypothetical protein
VDQIEERADLAEIEEAEGALWDAAMAREPRHQRMLESYGAGRPSAGGHPTEQILEARRAEL